MQPNKTPDQTEKTAEVTSVTPAAATPPVATSTPQQATPTQPQPQYIVTHRSLEGVGGWLVFWVVMFAFSAIGSIYSFFAQISGEVDMNIAEVIFAPILAIVAVAAILLIVMRKKIGKWVAISAYIVGGLYSTVNLLIHPIDNIAMMASTLLVLWLIVGLLSLYFVKSERVKQTLIR